MLVLFALACATNPLNRSNAVVPTQGEGAWAKHTAYTAPNCTDITFELVLPLSLVQTYPGSSAGLWQQAYPYMLDKNFTYLLFSKNASVAIVRGCNRIQNFVGDLEAEVFIQCDATAAPTSAPTPPPSYGPLVESACESGWNWGAFDDNGHIFVRYCDTPVCNGVFYLDDLLDNACPPYPGEALVQVNTSSDICRSNSGIEMMYNGGDYLCNGTHLCSNDNSLYYNACIPPYPNYGPMNESECLDMGGVEEDWAIHAIDDHVTTRYCNVSVCNQVYTNGEGDVYSACPATPSEGRIRNNAFPCDYCIQYDVITMMYCNETCTGVWRCPNNPTLFLNACTDAYTPGPYGPMTEEECIAMGGSSFDVTQLDDTDQILVRYCDVPICYLQYGLYVNACPPTPDELQVMVEDCEICLVAGETWSIEMMYCGDVDGCTSTHLCSTNHNLLDNACVGAYPDYGPMTVEECVALGGNASYWANATENGLVTTRYCGNIPQCNGTYLNSWEDHYNACPPLPSEGRVRNNVSPCDYCVVNGTITMMYCNGTCTGTYACPGTSGLYENACTLYYPDAVPDYGPMSEEECLEDYGGTSWAEYNFSDTGVRYARYCVGALPCWQHFNPADIDEVIEAYDSGCSNVTLPEGAIVLDVQNVTGFCLVYNVTLYGNQINPHSIPFNILYFESVSLDVCAAEYALGLSQVPFLDSQDFAPFNSFSWEVSTGWCTFYGGPLEGSFSYSDDSFIIGIPINATFMNNNACPPLPSEARVRFNSEPCTYCMGDQPGDPIEMMYCGNTEGCTGHFYCSHAGVPYDGPYTNACTELYPIIPTFAPTSAPTSTPTTFLYMPICFVFDGFQCSNDPSNGDTTWCKQDDFYKVAQYSIHPHALSEMTATAEDVALLDNPEEVEQTVFDWLGNASESIAFGVCWCATKSTQWFPYGPVAYANVSSFQTIGNTSFPHDFFYKHSTFTYYTDLCVRADALVVIQNNGTSTIAEFGDTTPSECPCTYQQSSLTLFDSTQCSFVCVAPFYVGDIAPLSLARTPASNVSECASSYFLWINQWHLMRMIHALYWQSIASAFTVAGPLQYTWVPWWNTTIDTNCVALSEGYCSLVLVPYATYTDFWDGDSSKLALDYAGVRTWNNSTNDTLNRLIPVIYADVTDEQGEALQAAVHMLFWTNMATLSVGNPDALLIACQGNKTYSLPMGVKVTVPVVWVGGWNKSNCTGLYGCALLSAENCSLYPGCVYMQEHTQTSTTTTTTLPPGTLPPPVATTTMPSQLQLDSDAFSWLFFIAAVAAVVLIVVSAQLRRPPPPYTI